MKFGNAFFLTLLIASALMIDGREAAAQRDEILAGPNPIPAHDTVWLEEMTFFEVRDALASGDATTALILGASLEQNGPYLPTGKHIYILRQAGEAIARKLGNALVAPIITFEPGPVTGGEPGSMYITEETYLALMTDMANSLRSQGFKHIMFMGDSGGNQRAMEAVAQSLNAAWKGEGAVAHYIPEYYNNADTKEFIANTMGIREDRADSDNIHDEYFITVEMAAYDPEVIRFDERMSVGKTTINGISILPIEQTIENGKKVIDFRATVAADAIRQAIAESGS